MKKLMLSVLLCAATLVIFAQGKTTAHKVVKGETLYSISKKYHTTVAAIEKANKALSGDMKLKLAQTINIPAASSAEAAEKAETKPATATKTTASTTVKSKGAGLTDVKPTATTTTNYKAATDNNPSTHTIAKGESLYSLAKKYNVTLHQLREANGMNEESKLKIGQKLNIPTKNTEAMFKPVAKEPQPEPTKPVTQSKPETQPGREYLANDNEPVQKPVEKKEVEKKEVEKKEPEPVKPTPTPVPVKVTEEKPATPAVTDKPKEMVKEEKAPEPKEPKSPPVEAMNTNVNPSDYSTVFNGYAGSTKKKTVYRGVGSFLKSDNPGNQFLALYNYADMGAILKVTNLMSKQAIYVKVIGKVPAADTQSEVILKVSSDAAAQLKVSEDKFLVEVTGYSGQ